jgi:hypothetical protein
MCGVGGPISDASTGRANALQLLFPLFPDLLCSCLALGGSSSFTPAAAATSLPILVEADMAADPT